jgi:hypothetical protein
LPLLMATQINNFGRRAAVPACSMRSRLARAAFYLVLLLALALPMAAAAADTGPGKLLEELRYQVDVFIWQDAVNAKVRFLETGPGRYQAQLDGQAQGLLSMLTGNWRGSLSTEMEYSQGRLQPLVHRETSFKKGNKRVMEYRFDYVNKKVELWKQEGDKPMVKRWETALDGPMYDPLTFFYNRRLTGAALGEKGGENLKFQGIPYPKPDQITLRMGEKTAEGRKIMVDLGNRLYKDERSQVYAILDADGVPTKAWTKIMKFGNVDIKLLPGGKRLNKAEMTGTPSQPTACRN